MLGGAALRKSVVDLAAQLAELRGRVEALAGAPGAPAAVAMPERSRLVEAVTVADFFCREVSTIAAEVLQLGYGYDIDTVQMLWTRFGAGDRQVFFAALTGPGGEGLAMHLDNAAEDPDFGDDFSVALGRLTIAGRRFLETIQGIDATVAEFYVNGPLGAFLRAARQPSDSPAEA